MEQIKTLRYRSGNLVLIASNEFSSGPSTPDSLILTGTQLSGWNIPELTPTNVIVIIKSGRTSGSFENYD